ncbi:type VI secretion system lipoprotein TssJ [Caballeronia hypogeia]|nr:type VI secretion system lipoprotein TssJ [Caballeronia hypogeia]
MGLALTVLLSGCGVWQAASDSTVDAYDTVFHNRGKSVNVDLSAIPNLNPDDAGHPRSVAVRVYQLKDRKRFDAASFNDLLTKDDVVLEADVQARMAAVVNPGGSASMSQPMERDTKVIAIAAFYPSADKTESWKQVVAVKKLPADVPLELSLAERALSVFDEPKAIKR